MMYDFFLLRNDVHASRFQEKYPQSEKALQKFEQWFYGFPLYQWQQVALPKDKAEFIIGMLCLLRLAGRANFCFKFPGALSGAFLIMRYARDDAECQEYLKRFLDNVKTSEPKTP